MPEYEPPAWYLEQSTDSLRASGTAHARRVKMVERAFTLLPGPAHGPSEIAQATGLDASVVYRILQSCIPSAYFVRLPAGKYRLGPGAARIGIHAMAHSPGAEASHPILERLSKALDAMALLWVFSPYGDPRRALADYAPGRYDLEALGLTASELVATGGSLRVGPSGRAIAAHLPAPLVDRVVAGSVPTSAGPGALGDAAFLASLQEIRADGVGVGREEIAGWAEVAAPVLWGEVIYGAISVLKPSSLLKDTSDAITRTIAAADRLSALVCGGSPTPAG
ncbi:IclR family transcriptional regulator (plasmid) [Streptomyces sp. NBC_00445]|uniref:IclR family transcriptional regulator n=1 Tax=Streptomyces sp. NBC_00445 TaxID=2975745 RepID=UPI002E1CB464